MARKTHAEIEVLFKPYLHASEEIRWIGEPVKNLWRLNLGAILTSGFLSLIKVLRVVWPVTALLLFIGLIIVLWNMNVFLSICLGSGFLWLLAIEDQRRSSTVEVTIPKPLSKASNAIAVEAPKAKLRFGGRTYYAITNQRVLILDLSTVHDYSMLLLADAVVAKPKHEASTIYLYHSTNPTGHLPEPVFQLKGIAEEEAQSAYDILRQAREEALEDRAREMGIE